jgi:hypothetical protein
MVVDVFKEQLATIMEWHRRDLPSFKWGVVLHRRNERGRIRFGAVTSGGESLVLTSEAAGRIEPDVVLARRCGPVRLECRSTSELPRNGPPSIARPRGPGEEPGCLLRSWCHWPDAALFAAMAGELTLNPVPPNFSFSLGDAPPLGLRRPLA